MDTHTLANMIDSLERMKAAKDDMQDTLKKMNEEIAQAEAQVIAAMADVAEAAGLDDPSMFTVDVNGRRYGLRIKNFYRIPADRRDEAFAALRALNLGDLIVERVDDRTLTKALEELADESGELPDEYAVLPVSVYTKTTLSARKVAR